MKELLSIKEKAHRYDKALRVVEKLHRSWKETQNRAANEIEAAFPELRESEDERIRNFISNELACLRENDENGSDRYNELTNAIAWLEKQGESYTKKDVADAWFKGICDAKRELEKQAETSPIHSNSSNIGKDEQKPEPKFRVGDWVVYDTEEWREVLMVDRVDDGIYHLVNVNGETCNALFEEECNMHLWGIGDAKDGDALVASDGSIFLFKGTVGCACKHYAALTTDGAVKFNEGLKHYWETSTAVYPATKEQRDQLEKAITEAGYEWDAEKKELKKIGE